MHAVKPEYTPQSKRRGSNSSSQKGVEGTNPVRRSKNQSAISRLVMVPWSFGGAGLLLSMCVVVFVLTFQYICLSSNVENMVVGKATIVLDGAVQSVRGYRAKVERVSGLIQQHLSKAGNTSQDPYYFLNSLNNTLHRTVGTRVRSRLINMVVVYVLSDPVPLTAFPKQNLQSSCLLCARPGDPTFTKALTYGLIRDVAPETQDEYRSISANPNSTGSFYTLQKVNRAVTPSWAETTDDLSNKKLVPLSPFRVQNFIVAIRNGSAFDGTWFPVEVTSGASGVSYYFSGFSQQFVHPNNNLTIVVNVFSGIKAFQDVLAKSTISQSISSNAHLLLIDHLARVITYNHDIYGDRRLANCTVSVLPGTPNRPCGDLYGVEHPTPFIARLIQNHKGFIMSFGSARQMWFSDEGSRYLLVAQDISSDHSQIAAVFVLPEKDVVGNLKRGTLGLVIFSAVAVLIGCLVVVVAGFTSLRNTQRTVMLVAKVASSIARYDVDEADATIAEEQSSRICLTAATPMEKQFSEIVDNLRAYRPFLPPSLFLETRQNSTGRSEDSFHSTSSSPTPAPLFTHRSERFVPFVGSLVLVDIGNLPVAAHIPHRSAEVGERVINAFFHQCLHIVERHGGVTESIQANQLLVTFNCHKSTPQHQQVACQCALELQAALTGNSAWCAHRINVAISVASGAGLLGSGGTATVKGRLIAGEAVDLIRRLPNLQRILGVGVLATEATVMASSGAVVVVPVDVISPKWAQEGRGNAIVVYEVVALTKLVTSDILAECKIRTTGFNHLHHTRDPVKAAMAFLQLPSDVMGRYSVMRLIYLSELLATQSYSNLHRNETPWEELEGRAFFGLYRAEDLLTMKRSNRQPHNQNPHHANCEVFDCNVSLGNVGVVGGAGSIEHGESPTSPFNCTGPSGSLAGCSGSTATNLTASSSLRIRSCTNAPSVMAVSGDTYFAMKKSHTLLGREIFGSVVLALHEKGGLVAMRQIPFRSLKGSVKLLIQEMELLSSLNHPSIASYITCAVNQEDNIFCIMSEYLPAGTLYDLVRESADPRRPVNQSTMSIPITIRFATDIAAGLHYLHTRSPPILHLDINPHNILMTAEGSCKLVEFGTSRFFSDAIMSVLFRETPMYMAPEAAFGEFSAAADVYSLGITVLHLLLGRPPWDHVPNDGSFLARLTQDTTLRPNIPDWIDPKLGALLERCTSHNPTHRPTTTEVLRDLALI